MYYVDVFKLIDAFFFPLEEWCLWFS